MGSRRFNDSRRPPVSRDDLRVWAHANLDGLLEPDYLKELRISYALVSQSDDQVQCLISVRDCGKHVFSARRTVMALVRGARGRITELKRTRVVTRNGQDDAAWRKALFRVCRDAGIDPGALERLAPFPWNVAAP